MSLPKVHIVKVDPYHKIYMLPLVQIVPRFGEIMEQLGDETGAVALNFFPRLWARDAGVLLLAAVDPDTGLVKGFTAAGDVGGECVMLQPRLDEQTENDAVSEMIEAVETWAKGLGFRELTMISRRSDPKWMKKHNFEIAR